MREREPDIGAAADDAAFSVKQAEAGQRGALRFLDHTGEAGADAQRLAARRDALDRAAGRAARIREPARSSRGEIGA